MKKALEWLQGLGIMTVMLGVVIAVAAFIIINLGNIFSFLGNILMVGVGLCIVVAIIWVGIKLKKVFFKPQPLASDEELFEYYVFTEISRIITDYGKGPAFYVLSAAQNIGISYRFVSPVYDVKGRYREIWERVVSHTIENQRFRGGQPHWLQYRPTRKSISYTLEQSSKRMQ